MFTLKETDKYKKFRSPTANYNFRKSDGYSEMWGETKDDEILFSEYGPFILDIEVTTICDEFCNFCYKKNTKVGENMSLETFKKIFDKVNKNRVVNQFAFGADNKGTSNQDLFEMMAYCRANGVIPNITLANVSEEVADKLVNVCGAVAISKYTNKNVCYDSVKRLTDRGLKQTNIHMLVSKNTKDQIWELFHDSLSDPRLEKLNAIVLLTLKKKGRGVSYDSIEENDYNELVNFALKNNIRIGFDSCGAGKFLKTVKDHPNYEQFLNQSQPCESTRESFYIDVQGKAYPCSFCPGTESFDEGLDVLNCENFVDDVWNHPRTIAWREHLLRVRESGNFDCPIFKI